MKKYKTPLKTSEKLFSTMTNMLNGKKRTNCLFKSFNILSIIYISNQATS